MSKEQIKKLCVGCDKTKYVDGNFYKAGNYFQKLCKICHNDKRKKWKIRGKMYDTPRLSSFQKLPQDIQDSVTKDFQNPKHINTKAIFFKYKTECETRGINFNYLMVYRRRLISS